MSWYRILTYILDSLTPRQRSWFWFVWAWWRIWSRLANQRQPSSCLNFVVVMSCWSVCFNSTPNVVECLPFRLTCYIVSMDDEAPGSIGSIPQDRYTDPCFHKYPGSSYRSSAHLGYWFMHANFYNNGLDHQKGIANASPSLLPQPNH